MEEAEMNPTIYEQLQCVAVERLEQCATRREWLWMASNHPSKQVKRASIGSRNFLETGDTLWKRF